MSTTPQNGTPTKNLNTPPPSIEVKTPMLPNGIDRTPSSSNLLRSPSMSRTSIEKTPGPKLQRQDSITEFLWKKSLSLATGKDLSTPKKDKVSELTDEVIDYKARTDLLINEFKLFKTDSDNKIAALKETKRENLDIITNLKQQVVDTITDRESKLTLLKSQQLDVITKMESRYDSLHSNYVSLRKNTADEIEKLTWEKKGALDQAENSEKLRLQNIEDEKKERNRLQEIHDAQRDDLLGKIRVLTDDKEAALLEGRNLLSKLTNLNSDYVELQRATKEEINRLKSELEASHGENKRLNDVIQEMEAHRVELDQMIANRNQHIAELEDTIRQNISDLEEAAHKIKVLEKNLESALKLAADNEKLYRQNMEYEKLVRDRLIKGHEEERIGLLANIDNLSDSKRSLEENLKITTETLEKTTRDFEEAKIRNEREQYSLKQELTRLRDEKNKDRATFDDVEKTLTLQVQKLEAELVDTIARYESQVIKLNKELKDLKDKSSKHIDDLTSQNQSLTEENLDMKQKHESITNESKLLVIDLTKTRKENEVLIKTKESLQSSMTTLEQEETKLHSLYEETKAGLEQVTLQLRNSENEINRMKSDNKALIDSDSKSQKQAKEALRELEFTNEALKRLQAEYAELDQSNEAFKAQQEILKSESGKLHSRISQLEVEVKHAGSLVKDNKMGDLSSYVHDVKSELEKSHKLEIEKLLEEIKVINKEKAENEEELDELNNKLLSLAKEKKALEDMVYDLKSTHEKKMKQLMGEKQKIQNDLFIISSDKNFLQEKLRLDEQVENLKKTLDDKSRQFELEKKDLERRESEAIENMHRNMDEEKLEREKLLKSFSTEKSQVVGEITKLRDEKRQFDIKEKEFMEITNKLNKIIDGLKSDLEKSKENIKNLSLEKEKLNDVHKTQEIENLKSQISKLKEDVEAIGKDKTKYTKAYLFEKNLKEQALNLIKKKDPNASFTKEDLSKSFSGGKVEIIELPFQNEDKLNIKVKELESEKQDLQIKFSGLTGEMTKKMNETEQLRTAQDRLEKEIQFLKSQLELKEQVIRATPEEKQELLLKGFHDKEANLMQKIDQHEKDIIAFDEERKKFALLSLQVVDLKQHNVERYVLDQSILHFRKPEYINKIPTTVKTVYLSLVNFSSFDSRKNQTFCDNVLKAFDFVINEQCENLEMMTYWLITLYRLFALIRSDYPSFVNKVLEIEESKTYSLQDFKPNPFIPTFNAGRTNKFPTLEEMVNKFTNGLYHTLITNYFLLISNIFNKIETEVHHFLFDPKDKKNLHENDAIKNVSTILESFYVQLDGQKVDEAVLSHFFKTVALHIDEFVFNALLTNKITSERGIKVKIILSAIEGWFESKSIQVSFPYCREAADSLLLEDKKKLIEKYSRKEVCGKLTSAQLATMFKNFSPESDLPVQLVYLIGNDAEGKPVQIPTKVTLTRSIIDESLKNLLFDMDFPQTKANFASVKLPISLISRKELQFLNNTPK